MDEAANVPALLEEIARLRRELAVLHGHNRVFNSLLDNAPLLISTKDLEGRITMANRHFEVLDGYDAANFVGRSVFELFPPEIADQLWRNDRRAALEQRAVLEEEAVHHRDKTLHTYMTVKFPLYDEHGQVNATCAVSTDITQARAAEDSSVTDELTGLKNRRYFNMRFSEEQKRARRDGRLLTLLLLDVDRFKQYNDHYGHPAGDAVLQAVAHSMRAALHRAGDLCFRIGGDEFACLYTSSGTAESLALAAEIRAEMAAHAIPHRDNPPGLAVTLSMGAAFLAAGAELGLDQLYLLADQALYRAKHLGRDRIAT